MSQFYVLSIDVKGVQRIRTNLCINLRILGLFIFFKMRYLSQGVTLQACGLRCLDRSLEAEISIDWWLCTISASLTHCILVVTLMRVDYLVHLAH